MRLWSIHPQYFDRQALTACWREGLLAQSVLGKTSGGYSNHPQLSRFRGVADGPPASAMWTFLHGLADEADARGYHFAREKILGPAGQPGVIAVTSGQRDFEWSHLMTKLQVRSPVVAKRWAGVGRASPTSGAVGPRVHPVFRVVDGPVEPWERGAG